MAETIQGIFIDPPIVVTAGPGFGLTRHVMLPLDADNVKRLTRERLEELASLAASISKQPFPDLVRNGCRHLEDIATAFSR